MAAPLFSRRATTIARVLMALGVFSLIAIPGLMIAWVRTPVSTGEGGGPEQPMPFDHRMHVTGFRIDCLYCHATAESEANAGVPATEICVSCHLPVWLNSPAFAPVRRSLATGKPIPWRRVDLLPGFSYFDHAAHTRHGIGCETCHGRVDRMKRVVQGSPLTMGWCLDCHQVPYKHLRPLEEVTNMAWQPPRSAAAAKALRLELARRYQVKSLISCYTCHR